MKPVVLIFSIFFMVANTNAERCATPDEVRDRLISPDYEWSVSEDVSLNGVLSVTKLYAVTIENYGEFVACKYEASQQYIRLDGAPKMSNCPVRALSDNWFVSEAGQTVCDEENSALCRFEFGC